MIVIYAVAGIIALALIAALFTTKEYTLSREITISQPDSAVFDYLRYLRHHRDFNAWFLKDPAMQATVRSTDGQVGCMLTFDGNKDVGSGELELTGLQPGKKIDMELRFIKPFRSTSRTPFELQAAGAHQTKVRWTMHGAMSYPMNLALLFVNMDSFLGSDLQKSLDNLKHILEK